MSRRKSVEERLREMKHRHKQLAARLAGIGPIHEGSVTRQRLACGKPNCACRNDPDRRHGPYAYWTTKVGGKTVSRRLSPDEADVIEEWIANRREIDRTKKCMAALSRAMLPLVLATRAETHERATR